LGAAEAPAAEDYLCVRADLAAPARTYDTPVWAFEPRAAQGERGAAAVEGLSHHPETWRVSIWPVDSKVGGFLAMRAFARPPADMPVAIRLVDAAPGSS
ncbi:hypothetical protein H632_c2556p0, partial [Helicosporidium sp. ATCC 50920]